ncbi:hypothetical protein [Roseibium sp. MB-4]
MKQKGPTQPPQTTSAALPAKRTLICDLEQFRPYLEEANLSKAQEEEFLQTLWSIISSFVDLGFGIHDLQKLTEPDEFVVDLNAYLLSDQLNSYPSFKNKFDAVRSGKPESASALQVEG